MVARIEANYNLKKFASRRVTVPGSLDQLTLYSAQLWVLFRDSRSKPSLDESRDYVAAIAYCLLVLTRHCIVV